MKTTKRITLLVALAFMQLFFIQCSSSNGDEAAKETTSCDCSVKKEMTQETGMAMTDNAGIAVSTTTPTCNIRIAYVDYDSLLVKYNFAQDIQKELIRKELSINNTIEEERKSLQEEAAAFEHKVQNNVFATQERAQSEYEKIMKKDQDLLQRGQEMIAELEEYRNTKFTELTKCINEYIKEYNSNAGYDFILTRMGGNMLYANEALDITKEIINGLNAKYKAKKK